MPMCNMLLSDRSTSLDLSNYVLITLHRTPKVHRPIVSFGRETYPPCLAVGPVEVNSAINEGAGAS
jgi:hypothetical protein